MLQVLTGDENFKIRKTEIDSLLRTDTVEFFSHLNFFQNTVDERMKKLEIDKMKK